MNSFRGRSGTTPTNVRNTTVRYVVYTRARAGQGNAVTVTYPGAVPPPTHSRAARGVLPPRVFTHSRRNASPPRCGSSTPAVVCARALRCAALVENPPPVSRAGRSSAPPVQRPRKFQRPLKRDNVTAPAAAGGHAGAGRGRASLFLFSFLVARADRCRHKTSSRPLL